MVWNYRVIRQWEINPVDEDGQMPYVPCDGIHEVFYDDDGNVKSWTESPVAVFSYPHEDGLYGLLWQLENMAEAIEKPWLEKCGENELRELVLNSAADEPGEHTEQETP